MTLLVPRDETADPRHPFSIGSCLDRLLARRLLYTRSVRERSFC
jgi:hypothetical protein